MRPKISAAQSHDKQGTDGRGQYKKQTKNPSQPKAYDNKSDIKK
jgi:hypothetical protein